MGLRLAALGLVAAATVAGCAGQADDATTNDALGGAPATATATNDLGVFTNESPSGGADFTFCAQPPASQPVQLTNAAWLAMLAANEYAYLGYFAPQLLDLGFGGPGDSMWSQCGLDFGRVKKYELAHAAELDAARTQGAAALVQWSRRAMKDTNGTPESFGACARDFLDKTYDGHDEDGAAEIPSSALKDYLVRKTNDTNWIQFFSAKPFTFLEKQLGRGSTQALVARHGKKPVIVIAFRGTEPPTADGDQYRQYADLLKDADFFKTDLSSYGFSRGWGSAHRGFVSALAALDDPDHRTVLMDKLQALTKDNPDAGIWITGHSLGAALATLMAARVMDRIEQGAHFNLKGVYTFGSPMVGNDTFKQKFEDTAKKHGVTIARFRNDQDVITAFPGVLSVFNYKHVGPIAFLTKSGLTLPSSDPDYGTKTLDDHSISGIVGPAGKRETRSGYYARILAQLKTNAPAALTACDAR